MLIFAKDCKNISVMGSTYYQELKMGCDEEYAKEEVQKLYCNVHNKRARISCDYDNFGSNAYIYRYCCPDFAKEVKEVISNMKRFNKIEIEDITKKRAF